MEKNVIVLLIGPHRNSMPVLLVQAGVVTFVLNLVTTQTSID